MRGPDLQLAENRTLARARRALDHSRVAGDATFPFTCPARLCENIFQDILSTRKNRWMIFLSVVHEVLQVLSLKVIHAYPLLDPFEPYLRAQFKLTISMNELNHNISIQIQSFRGESMVQ